MWLFTFETLEDLSLNSIEDIALKISANVNNLFVSSKICIFTGDKSGIIKLPLESSYNFN